MDTKIAVIVKHNDNLSAEYMLNQIDAEYEIIESDYSNINYRISLNEDIENCNCDIVLSVNNGTSLSSDFIKNGIRILNEQPEIGIIYTKAVFSDFDTEKGIPYTVMFRKEDFINAGKYKTYLYDGSEDYDLWITLLEQGFESYKIDS